MDTTLSKLFAKKAFTAYKGVKHSEDFKKWVNRRDVQNQSAITEWGQKMREQSDSDKIWGFVPKNWEVPFLPDNYNNIDLSDISQWFRSKRQLGDTAETADSLTRAVLSYVNKLNPAFWATKAPKIVGGAMSTKYLSTGERNPYFSADGRAGYGKRTAQRQMIPDTFESLIALPVGAKILNTAGRIPGSIGKGVKTVTKIPGVGWGASEAIENGAMWGGANVLGRNVADNPNANANTTLNNQQYGQ